LNLKLTKIEKCSIGVPMGDTTESPRNQSSCSLRRATKSCFEFRILSNFESLNE